MNIKLLGSNQTLLTTNHGDEVLYSYETAVAGFSPKVGYFRTTTACSQTTTKHINKYLRNVNPDNVSELTPQEIEFMFLGE